MHLAAKKGLPMLLTALLENSKFHQSNAADKDKKTGMLWVYTDRKMVHSILCNYGIPAVKSN